MFIHTLYALNLDLKPPFLYIELDIELVNAKVSLSSSFQAWFEGSKAYGTYKDLVTLQLEGEKCVFKCRTCTQTISSKQIAKNSKVYWGLQGLQDHFKKCFEKEEEVVIDLLSIWNGYLDRHSDIKLRSNVIANEGTVKLGRSTVGGISC